MRGKTAARAATLLALTWVVAPIWGQDQLDREDPPVSVDLEFGASGGRMALLRPAGCSGPAVRPASYGGTYGRVGLKSPATDGLWEHRLVGEVSGDLRSAIDDSGDFRVTGLGRATVGWSSRFAGVSLGGWAGNVDEDEGLMGFGSASIRLGFPDRHLRVSLFDQPGCYLSVCILGAEGLWTFDGVALRLGASVGMVAWRGYAQLPFRLGDDLPWLHPGIEVGMDEDENAIFGLTLGVSLPSL